MSAEWLTFLPSWIAAIASAVTAVSVLIIWAQAALLRKQLTADHERSRRQLAISLMEMWATDPLLMSPLHRSACSIVHGLSAEQVDGLRNTNELEIDQKHKTHVEVFLAELGAKSSQSKKESRIVNGKYRLTEAEVFVLNSLVLRYLNLLETVAASWRLGIADQTAIEEEFKRIIEPKSNRFTLETYREASGVYPSIYALAEKIKANKREQTAPKKTLPTH